MIECPCCGDLVHKLVESKEFTPMCAPCYEDTWDAKLEEYDECL